MQNCRVTYIIRRAKWKSILCSDDVKDKNNEPEISIVVPIVNEIEELFGFLENLAAQKDIHFQLLVVDGGSTDGSVEYLQQQQLIPNLLLVQGPTGRGIPDALARRHQSVRKRSAAALPDWLQIWLRSSFR